MNYRKVLALLIISSFALLGYGFFSIEPLEIPYFLKRISKSSDPPDCGPRSLELVLSHYGIKVSLADLMERTQTTQEGTTLLALRNSARELGLTAEGWMVNVEDLQRIDLPAIVYIHGKHFSVLNEASEKEVLLIDPDRGALRIPLEDFLEIWEGQTLLFAPSAKSLNFEESAEEEST